MKKWMSLLTVMCFLGLCGCNDKDQEQESSRQELMMNIQTQIETTWTEAQSEGTVSAETEIIPDEASVPDQTAEFQTQSGTQISGQNQMQNDDSGEMTIQTQTVPTEGNPVQQTTVAATVPPLSPDETTPAEGVFGAEGRTEEEWMILGKEMYMQAMEVSFQYLCSGSVFPFDTENLEIIDRTYFLTTCTSYEEATAPYYELFSREYHAGDFDGLLLEQDGRLYAARAARGMDLSYLSSQVTELVSVSETEVVFHVYTEYQDSEVTETFTLVPEDGFWKVGAFILPY